MMNDCPHMTDGRCSICIELETLVETVDRMRGAQILFFANRSNPVLEASKKLEKKVDELIRKYKQRISGQPVQRELPLA